MRVPLSLTTRGSAAMRDVSDHATTRPRLTAVVGRPDAKGAGMTNLSASAKFVLQFPHHVI